MKANIGSLDRVIRMVFGAALVAMAIAQIMVPWTWIGVIPLATGALSWCPLYAVFGRSTCNTGS